MAEHVGVALGAVRLLGPENLLAVHRSWRHLDGFLTNLERSTRSGGFRLSGWLISLQNDVAANGLRVQSQYISQGGKVMLLAEVVDAM